ncbi:hypothetical protein [Phenylobacterium sp.]|uniref:hypothetical protein n=1 Tax=Phenylobacterium sp. TaxID=1871053 RepID=UPI0026012376|nr:hypothetical protein [Phenylobacterium sp.]
MIVQAMRRHHADHTLDQPGSVFRDAYVAAKCATAWKADGVRLGADPPDFELKHAGRVERYEVAEFIAPGRRRGNELKADRLLAPEQRNKPQHIPQEQWTPAASALEEVARVAREKADKGYPAYTSLVLYLNIWPVAGQAAYQRGIGPAVAPALNVFKEVWVLGNGTLRQIGFAS